MVWAPYLCPLSQPSFRTHPLPLLHSQTIPTLSRFSSRLRWINTMHWTSSGHTEQRGTFSWFRLESRWCPKSCLPSAVLTSPHFPHIGKGSYKHAILVALTIALFLSLAMFSICSTEFTVREAILLISYCFLNFPLRLKNSFRELETMHAGLSGNYQTLQTDSLLKSWSQMPSFLKYYLDKVRSKGTSYKQSFHFFPSV